MIASSRVILNSMQKCKGCQVIKLVGLVHVSQVVWSDWMWRPLCVLMPLVALAKFI